MQRNVEHSAKFFQAFNSVIRNFTGSSSQCFEAPTALNLSLFLSFYRTNVEPIDQSKATWAKSFLTFPTYCKQIIQNQGKTVRRAVTINVCWRKSSCELFPLVTTHALVYSAMVLWIVPRQGHLVTVSFTILFVPITAMRWPSFGKFVASLTNILFTTNHTSCDVNAKVCASQALV